jgi:arylformamidase
MNLEAEYNNRARVPESSAIIAGWTHDADVFRRSYVGAELDVPYGPTERQKLDLFWPAGSRAVPVAMYIHGGNWQMLDRASFSHVAAGLLGNGVAVALPSYDLCPSVPLAEIVKQIRRAGVFLACRVGGPFLCIGHSAGAHLTAMLMAHDWVAEGLPTNTISAALLISGMFDLEPLVSTSVNAKLGLSVSDAVSLSPALLPRPSHCHFHALVGGQESGEFHRQTRVIADAWGGTSEITAGANHFTIIAPFADPKSELVALAIRLLPH